MRAARLAAMVATACLAAGGGPLLAFDDAQFCVAAKEFIRSVAGDVGTWTDRLTRNDGVEIGCDTKVVHFKRFYSAPASSLRDGGWRERQAESWESAYCKRSIWREAVDNGWVVSATLTTVTGERLWLACLPGGRGFHRVIP
jgi:hypothetical protein